MKPTVVLVFDKGKLAHITASIDLNVLNLDCDTSLFHMDLAPASPEKVKRYLETVDMLPGDEDRQQ